MWKRIQKFGPSHCDLSTIVSNVNVLMRVLTLNVDSKVTTPISTASIILTVSCIVSYYYAYHISMLWFVFWRPYRADLTSMIVYGSLAVSSNVAVIKLLYMIAYRSKVRGLVDQCLETNALTEPGSRFSRNMAAGLRIVKMRALTFWISEIIVGFLYITLPAFIPGRHTPEDLIVFYGLDPPFSTPNYEISYFIMMTDVLFICYTVATITVLVIISLGFIEVQMISLSEEILCIWDDAVQDSINFKIELICPLPKRESMFDKNTQNKINAGVRKKLADVMQRHARIITLLKHIDDFFNVPNALAFVHLAISLIAELLGGLENTYLQVLFTFFQVAIDCFIGQKVMDASMAFERAVYACKWENFDKNNMRLVLMLLRNSQKTLKVTAGNMVVMNYICLMSIVRSVYSTYTTLRSTMRK